MPAKNLINGVKGKTDPVYDFDEYWIYYSYILYIIIWRFEMGRKKQSTHAQKRLNSKKEKHLIELEKENAQLANLVRDLYEVICKKRIIKVVDVKN